MKMADRAHVNLPNRKPPWWSTAEYGIPMNYGQTAPRPTPGGRKLLTLDEVSGNAETALVKHAPGTIDIAKKAKKEQLMLEEEGPSSKDGGAVHDAVHLRARLTRENFEARVLSFLECQGEGARAALHA